MESSKELQGPGENGEVSKQLAFTLLSYWDLGLSNLQWVMHLQWQLAYPD